MLHSIENWHFNTWHIKKIKDDSLLSATAG